MKKCSIDGCESKAVGRGWCHKHYKRWQNYGDPEFVLNKRIHGMTLKERIEDTVNVNKETGCWEWLGSISQTGYGRLKVNRKTVQAHRASYIEYNGDIPEGIQVCHRCDNRKCVNPEHLFLGAGKQNMEDAVIKGRNVHCESHPKAKLSEEKVVDILRKELSAKEYADKYGVHWSSIYNVWRGVTWVKRGQK